MTENYSDGNYADFAADRAIDGNTSGDLQDMSITITNVADMNWCILDLGSNVSIDSIRVYNRTDCCKERLNGATVSIIPGAE